MKFFKTFLKKLFKNKNDRDLHKLKQFLLKIKIQEKKIADLSDNGLRKKTIEFKNIIQSAIYPLCQKEKKLIEKTKMRSCSIHDLEQSYLEKENIQKECYNIEQEILLKILPEAFAVIKETAKRFKEKKKLIVKSTLLDEELSKIKSYVTLKDGYSIWSNEWNAHGKHIIWNMVHYDVQLMGGVVLHQGKIAEMATGEGKTFVSTLSAYLNALSGRGVHIVTVNNYLSKRDANWMGPLMEFHGLRVDCLDNYDSYQFSLRKKAYLADITYGTNNEFGFDYLRDNMAISQSYLVQRELNYAIIDEIDSVLIDEARTPLIISGPVNFYKEEKQEFKFLKEKVDLLVKEQKKKVKQFLQESKYLIKSGNKQLGGLKLFQSYRGFPKQKSLIKFLNEDKIKIILQYIENIYLLQNNGKDLTIVDKDLYFVIDEKHNTVELTELGFQFLSKNMLNINFFVVPDINVELAKVETQNLPKNKEIKVKDQLIKNFTIKLQRIHTINQLLKAYTLFEKNIDYIIVEKKVKIVDEQTGRIMEGRRYSDGLHQAIEAKENLDIEASSQTLASITLQNYFRMYHKISGMTGTAETEASELLDIYKLDVVVIPTHKPIKRIDYQDLIFKTQREKYNAILEQIIYLSKKKHRPVLVGTTSVEISELLSRTLKFRKIQHNVLNAKLHHKEADIIAKAGLPGTVTIATNMAGRGTDIQLYKDVVQFGGLAVIGTERHDSRRVDNQLRGRTGRQGDPGSSQFYISLEDNLIRVFLHSEKLSKLMDRFGHKDGDIIQHPLLTKSIERAQKKIEDNNFSIRKRLLDYDDVINKQREFIYKKRKNALCGEKLNLDISNMVYSILYSLIAVKKSLFDYKHLKYEFLNIFGVDLPIKKKEFVANQEQYIINYLHDILIDLYEKKKNQIINKYLHTILYNNTNIKYDYKIKYIFTDHNKSTKIVVNTSKKDIINSNGYILFSIIEKKTILCFLDDKWKEHLREMDSLRHSVQNAVFEQKDPLIVYKQNAFHLFQDIVDDINKKIISFLFKSFIYNKE
ncbi:preprotein translocase subunit SecA [Blattabacterium cuenoti]|uniref:preprotein translocase subunit SecA n=1 Tax=Blattabacterium cuenoti TaxID=1653831 RepID=UPI00163C65EB|nr:helicase-related protein [Blattabacterium cuenoti]